MRHVLSPSAFVCGGCFSVARCGHLSLSRLTSRDEHFTTCDGALAGGSVLRRLDATLCASWAFHFGNGVCAGDGHSTARPRKSIFLFCSEWVRAALVAYARLQ